MTQPVSKLISKVSPMVRESRYSMGEGFSQKEKKKSKSPSIALEKKYSQEKRIIFMPFESRDDTSGTMIFSDHGFIEFPKDPGSSNFVKNRSETLANNNQDNLKILSKNFQSRKILLKWFRICRKTSFIQKRTDLVKHFWGSQFVAMKEFKKIQQNLQGILKTKENLLTENFWNDDSKVINSCYKDMRVYGGEIKKILDDVMKTKFGDKIVYNKIVKILEEKKNPGRRFRESKESKLSKDKLTEIFIKLVTLKYKYCLIELIEEAYADIWVFFFNSKNPKIILALNEKLTVIPDPETLKSKIIGNLDLFKEMILNHNIYEELNFQLEEILDKDLKLQSVSQKINQECDKDTQSIRKFINKQKSLENLISVFNHHKITNKDDFEYFRDNYQTIVHFADNLKKLPPTTYKCGIFILDTLKLQSDLNNFYISFKSKLKEKLPESVLRISKDLKEWIVSCNSLISQKHMNISQISQHLNSLSDLKSTKLVHIENTKEFILESIKFCVNEKIPINLPNEDLSFDKKSVLNQILSIENYYRDLKPSLEEQLIENSLQLSKKIKKFENKYVNHYLQDIQRLVNPINTIKELEKREEALLTMKTKVELFEEFAESLIEIGTSLTKNNQLQCRKDYEILHMLHYDTIKL